MPLNAAEIDVLLAATEEPARVVSMLRHRFPALTVTTGTRRHGRL